MLRPDGVLSKDDQGTTPDSSILQEQYFNERDGFIYRVADFIRIQEPDGEEPYHGDIRKGELHPVVSLVQGQEIWYVILQTVDGTDRKGYRYTEFKDGLNSFHRIKNPVSKTMPREAPVARPLTSRSLSSSIDMRTGASPRDED